MNLNPTLRFQYEEGYNDKLLYPVSGSDTKGSKGRSSSTRRPNSFIMSGYLHHHKLSLEDHEEEDEFATMETTTLGHAGHGDQINAASNINPCWESASKMFKTPLKAPAIPLPENLVIHIEKKFPK
jgi:hypothetical protein